MQKEFVTIQLDLDKVSLLKEHYSPYKVLNDGEYVDAMYKKDDIVITVYSGKKEKKKVTFIGNDALNEALLWDKEAQIKETKEKQKQAWEFFGSQIGSDEVGVGDFLAPMIVVASYVTEKDIKLLKELGVKDSKQLSDTRIREIGAELVKKIEYSKLTLSNDRYNELIAKENINSLKAKMHNRALYNLVNKHPDVIGVYVDQFVPKEKYYEYLNANPDENIVRDISFMTKGESLYPSVAVSSIIARYAFLLEMDKLNEKYECKIPLGASKRVNDFAKDFIQKHGIVEFNKIAKKNFANYKEVISVKLI